MNTPFEHLKQVLDNYSATLQSVAYILTASGAVIAIFRKRLSGIWKQARFGPNIREALTSEIRTVRQFPALAQSGIDVGELLDSPGLWVHPTFHDVSSLSSGTQVRDLADVYTLLTDGDLTSRLCIIGPATSGKSSIARRLFCEIGDVALIDRKMPIPLYVDLATVSPRPTTQEIANPVLSKLERKKIWIVDGLDEALYSNQTSIIERLWTTIGAEDRVVVFCRYSTFREYLYFNGSMTFTHQLQIEAYEPHELHRYAQVLLRHTASLAKEVSSEILNLLEDAVNRLILQTPLHVAMAIKISKENRLDNSHLDSIAQIYGRYLSSVLDRETAKAGCPFTSAELHRVFEIVASKLIERTPAGMLVRSPGSYASIEDLRAAAAQALGPERLAKSGSDIVKWITVRSLFESDQEQSATAAKWEFAHPTYCDYFISCSIMNTLQEDPERIGTLFRRVFPQEVYEFTNFALIGSKEKARFEQLVINVRQTIEREGVHFRKKDYLAELCVEQLGHLIAHVNAPSSVKLAKEIADRFSTSFIKRGVAIGLAFAGLPDELVAYVALLRRELVTRGMGELNRTNLMHQLAYFGDTDVIQNASLKDVDLIHVGNTIAKLVKQLGTDVHHPSRLLDMYTLESLIFYARTVASAGEVVFEYLVSCNQVAIRLANHPDGLIRLAAESLKQQIELFNKTTLEGTNENIAHDRKKTR